MNQSFDQVAPYSVTEVQELEAKHEPVTLGGRVRTLIAVLVPFLGLVTAIVLLWGWGFGWVELGLLVGMYLVTAVGVTVGFHRLFTHRSFETNRIVKLALGIMGSMAMQGSLMEWVAFHRRHHQYSDRPDDPHSPHNHGSGFFGTLKGFWHAHMGWFFKPDPTKLDRYVRDIRQSKLLRGISNLFPLWVAVGLIIPAAIGWLLTGGWMGLVLGLLWGGLVRIFLVHHMTWSINSVCHLWGGQPYRGLDQSRNNFIFGVLGLGEGWHNNHHAFPTSARHGLRWWQVDPSYWVIRVLAWLRLAWNVQLPSPSALAS